MTRMLSHSEIESLHTCQAQHAFAYTGHLSDGATLKPRETAPILTGGRAWGAAVAAWHANQGKLMASVMAHAAMDESLEQDIHDMRERGFQPLLDERLALSTHLHAVLDHYMATAEPLSNLTRIEEEFRVPIPSRGGKRGSNLYEFEAHIDGWSEEAGPMLVEFKLRDTLQRPELIMRSRQPRRYSWTVQEEWKRQGLERRVLGIYVDERQNAAPLPARLVKASRKGEGIDGRVPSHDKSQMTTVDAYEELCAEYGVDTKPETVDALRQRQWQQRVPIFFRSDELVEIGRGLVGAARLVQMLDSGAIFPERNARPATCGGCKFRRICDNPQDVEVVDRIFARTTPKRLRPPREQGSRS
jgi:hypothetical protein